MTSEHDSPGPCATKGASAAEEPSPVGTDANVQRKDSGVKAIDPAVMSSIALVVKNPDLYPEIFEALPHEIQDLVIDIIKRLPKNWDPQTRKFVAKPKIGPQGNQKTLAEWKKYFNETKKKKTQRLKKAIAA